MEYIIVLNDGAVLRPVYQPEHVEGVDNYYREQFGTGQIRGWCRDLGSFGIIGQWVDPSLFARLSTPGPEHIDDVIEVVSEHLAALNRKREAMAREGIIAP